MSARPGERSPHPLMLRALPAHVLDFPAAGVRPPPAFPSAERDEHLDAAVAQRVGAVPGMRRDHRAPLVLGAQLEAGRADVERQRTAPALRALPVALARLANVVRRELGEILQPVDRLGVTQSLMLVG